MRLSNVCSRMQSYATAADNDTDNDTDTDNDIDNDIDTDNEVKL